MHGVMCFHVLLCIDFCGLKLSAGASLSSGLMILFGFEQTVFHGNRLTFGPPMLRLLTSLARII